MWLFGDYECKWAGKFINATAHLHRNHFPAINPCPDDFQSELIVEHRLSFNESFPSNALKEKLWSLFIPSRIQELLPLTNFCDYSSLANWKEEVSWKLTKQVSLPSSCLSKMYMSACSNELIRLFTLWSACKHLLAIDRNANESTLQLTYELKARCHRDPFNIVSNQQTLANYHFMVACVVTNLKEIKAKFV